MLGDGKRRAFGKGGLPDAYQRVNGRTQSKRSSRKPGRRDKDKPLFGSVKRAQSDVAERRVRQKSSGDVKRCFLLQQVMV